MTQLYLFLIFMLIAAIVAVETKSLLGAIISLGAVGFSQAIIFLTLQAPDLAITQVVVETLTVVILIAAILKTTRIDTTRGVLVPSILGVAFIAVLLVVAIQFLRFLPSFGNPIMRVADFYINNGLSQTGSANLVTSVILDFRAYDTLGEATVLFAAATGVIVVLRKIGRKKKGNS